MPFELSSIAPRLALARDQHAEAQRHLDRRRAGLRTKVLKLERLVAHRELQTLRRPRKGRRYHEERSRKLAEAQAGLVMVRDALEALDNPRVVVPSSRQRGGAAGSSPAS